MPVIDKNSPGHINGDFTAGVKESELVKVKQVEADRPQETNQVHSLIYILCKYYTISYRYHNLVISL